MGFRSIVRRVLVLSSFSLIGILFFFIYSFLSFTSWSGGVMKFNSPDETANYFFSRQVVVTGSPSYHEPLLEVSKGFVHPRSMTVAGSNVVPVSFLGMVLMYGNLGKLFGIGVIPFITPFVAVLSAGFFVLLVRQFFSYRIALLSGLILLIHPAYWYNASRAMLPNVLFVDLLIIGFSLLIFGYRRMMRQQNSKQVILSLAILCFAGMSIGMSLAVRLSEAVWIFALVFFAFIYSLRRPSLSSYACVLTGIALPVLVLLFANEHVYGNPIIFGYQTIDFQPSAQAFEKSVGALKSFDIHNIASLLQQTVSPFFKYILPFGFAPTMFSLQFKDFFVKMFWWMIPLIMLGVGVIFREGLLRMMKREKDGNALYLGIFFAVSAWLIVYYGSWSVIDTVTKEIAIGSSYVRYWLPMSILSIPCIAYAFFFLKDRAQGWQRMLIGMCAAFFIGYSVYAVLLQPPEGLIISSGHVRENFDKLEKVKQFTPQDAIIISPRSDKIFFPERKTAQGYEGFAEIPLLGEIMKSAPVYYYGFWKKEDAAFLSGKFFTGHHLALEFVAQIDQNEYLYQVRSIK